MKPIPFDQINQPLREVLTLPLSETLRAGLALRDAGYDVPKAAADIHAYVLNWLLAIVAEHGAAWREVATGELVRAIDKGREQGSNDYLVIKTRKIRDLANAA